MPPRQPPLRPGPGGFSQRILRCATKKTNCYQFCKKAKQTCNSKREVQCWLQSSSSFAARPATQPDNTYPIFPHSSGYFSPYIQSANETCFQTQRRTGADPATLKQGSHSLVPKILLLLPRSIFLQIYIPFPIFGKDFVACGVRSLQH